jgi:hypothetical protein
MQTDSGGNQLTLYDYAPFGEELAGLDGRDAAQHNALVSLPRFSLL